MSDIGPELTFRPSPDSPPPTPSLVERSRKKGAKRVATRFTNEGRVEAERNWQAMLEEAGAKERVAAKKIAEVDLEDIKRATSSALAKLKQDPAIQPEFVRLQELSFKKRLEYLERMKFLEEIQASNSPWETVIEEQHSRIYPKLPEAFVRNFVSNSIMSLRATISKEVDWYVNQRVIDTGDRRYEITEEMRDNLVVAYENEVASEMVKFLKNASAEDLATIGEGYNVELAFRALEPFAGVNLKQFRSLLPDDKRNQSRKAVKEYMRKNLHSCIPEKQQVADLRAEFIVLAKEPQKPSRLNRVLDRLIPKGSPRRVFATAVLCGTLLLPILGAARPDLSKLKGMLPTPPRIEITLPSADWQVARSLSRLLPLQPGLPDQQKIETSTVSTVSRPPPVQQAPVNFRSSSEARYLAHVPAASEQVQQASEKGSDSQAAVEPASAFADFLPADSKLASLYEQGCLSLFEADIDGDGQPDVKVLDYTNGGGESPLCEKQMNLEGVYPQFPAGERLHLFEGEEAKLAVIKQTPAACALHAYFMGISSLINPKDENGLPVLVNPFLVGEEIGMTPEEYAQLAARIENEEKTQLVYGTASEEASRSGAINIAIQTAKKGEFKDFLRRFNVNLATQEESPDLFGRMPIIGGGDTLVLPKDLFSEEDITILKITHKVVFEGGIGGAQVLTIKPSFEQAKKIYTDALGRYYQRLVQRLNQADTKGVIFLELQSDETGMSHLYFVLGMEEVNGKKYFHAIEGRSGEPASWGFYEGKLTRNKDGSLYIPLDEIGKWQPKFEVMSRIT